MKYHDQQWAIGKPREKEEHQDFLRKYPAGYTCHYVRPGWKLPRRESHTA